MQTGLVPRSHLSLLARSTVLRQGPATSKQERKRALYTVTAGGEGGEVADMCRKSLNE